MTSIAATATAMAMAMAMALALAWLTGDFANELRNSYSKLRRPN